MSRGGIHKRDWVQYARGYTVKWRERYTIRMPRQERFPTRDTSSRRTTRSQEEGSPSREATPPKAKKRPLRGKHTVKRGVHGIMGRQYTVKRGDLMLISVPSIYCQEEGYTVTRNILSRGGIELPKDVVKLEHNTRSKRTALKQDPFQKDTPPGNTLRQEKRDPVKKEDIHRQGRSTLQKGGIN
jgi:hypothetical protein